ncbi:MAG: hypothetical protein ACE5OZ_08480 [Candidatus Heimdallarchaeota archaeon]
MTAAGEKGIIISFLLKGTLIAFFALFLMIDTFPNRSFTSAAISQVLIDPRLLFACLILFPWSKVERLAQSTGRLRLAQSTALAAIGILAISHIVMLMSSSHTLMEHRKAETELNKDKKLYANLGKKYPNMLEVGDFDPEIHEREVTAALFDWVAARVPGDNPWIIIAPNPSTVDFQMYEIEFESGTAYAFYLMGKEEGASLAVQDGFPILISNEAFLDGELKLTLERHLVVPFPSKWSNTSEPLDLVVWLDRLDTRPANFDADRTMQRYPLTWCVMEVADNGNGILDVSISPSCLNINEDTVRTLRAEVDEIYLIMALDERIPVDEEALRERDLLFAISWILLFATVPGTGYHSLRALRAIQGWKAMQLQNWAVFQKKLESLQRGLTLENASVNGYEWDDLKHFVDWNMPVTIRIVSIENIHLFRVIYDSAPLKASFIVYEDGLEDSFTKETGIFAVDFSQPFYSVEEQD